VARQTFTAREVARGEPFQLLAFYAGTVDSPVEVVPMADALASAGVKDGEFQALVTAFAGALRLAGGDDRSFTASFQAGARIAALAVQAGSRGVSTLPLLEAYRLYLVNHMSAKRCADNDKAAGWGAGEDPVSVFNGKLRVDPLAAIGPDEIKPSAVEGTATGPRACGDAECQAIAVQYRGLILDEAGRSLSAEYRKTDEWRGKLDRLLEAIAAWPQSPGSTAAADYLEKIAMYGNLANSVMGPERETVLRAMAAYVQGNGLQAEDRMAWFLPVNALMAHIALEPATLGRLAAELRASSDPIVALYATLEAAVPREPAQTVGLL
jgi:hypothetical protein